MKLEPSFNKIYNYKWIIPFIPFDGTGLLIWFLPSGKLT